MRKSIVIPLLVLAAFALLSLVSGASYLETVLPGGLPIGNALTAIGLCAAAGSAVGLSPRRTALRVLSVASLIGAVAWLPASMVLAGNQTLNFDKGRGVAAWLALSGAVVVAVSGALAWALIASFLAMCGRGRAA